MAAAFQRGVDIGVHGAREAEDLGLQPELGNLPDGIEIHSGDRGHARLDALDADFVELTGNGDLVVHVHDDAGRLLAVAEGGVVDLDPGGRKRAALTSAASL